MNDENNLSAASDRKLVGLCAANPSKQDSSFI
jgi:hypothetical protein